MDIIIVRHADTVFPTFETLFLTFCSLQAILGLMRAICYVEHLEHLWKTNVFHFYGANPLFRLIRTLGTLGTPQT